MLRRCSCLGAAPTHRGTRREAAFRASRKRRRRSSSGVQLMVLDGPRAPTTLRMILENLRRAAAAAEAAHQ